MKIIRLNDSQIKEILKEHIITGDRGDGVPNFMSPDDSLASEGGPRQKSISKEKLKVWIKQDPDIFCSFIYKSGYKRNEEMIDLSKIPEFVVNSILKQFYTPSTYDSSRTRLMPYFLKYQLKNHIQSIAEF